VDTLRELAAKQKRESEAPPSVGEDHRKRVEAMRFQRLKDSQPLRKWLAAQRGQVFLHSDDARVILASDGVLKALAEWDGWSHHVYYPWCSQPIEDNPAPGHFVVELVQGVKNGPRWVIVLDSEVVEVRSFQDGVNQP
jgi:hypothetical protein